MFEEADEWNVFHGNYKTHIRCESAFFFFTWQIKTVRHAKRPHCWKKKTNNEKKTIQLLGINREDENKREDSRKPGGVHFRFLRHKTVNKNLKYNETMSLSFNSTKTWNGITIKEKKVFKEHVKNESMIKIQTF